MLAFGFVGTMDTPKKIHAAAGTERKCKGREKNCAACGQMIRVGEVYVIGEGHLPMHYGARFVSRPGPNCPPENP